MTFSEKCVHKPVTTILVFILSIVLGIFCTTQLSVDMYPDMDLPYMLVYTSYDGAGPEEVEQNLTSTLESSLSGVSGLKKMQSRSMGGISLVILEFNFGTNLDAAGGDVRDKIDLVRNFLPDDADSPITIKLDPSMMPIMTLALKGNRTPEELRSLAEDTIESRLEQIDGVASANVFGGREKSINVDIPRDRLEAYGLTISSVAQMIGIQNIQSSGGTITSADTNYTIKNDFKYNSLDHLRHTVISYKTGSDEDVRTIRLRDIADVYEGYKDESTYAYLDGKSCVMINLQKQSGKNSVATAKSVRKTLEKLKAELPSDVEIIETSNTVDIISQTIGEVVSSVVMGALLAIAVLFVFLRSLKSTLIVGASIPISVMITLLCMYLNNITINMISMAGLLLGIGMLVDNSIVVLENIYSYIERDTKPRVAAILGSQEMVASITGSTLTSVCIFLPMLVFKSKLGIMGQMFNDIAWTIIFSLMSSLIVAMALVPVLCSVLVKKQKTNTASITYGINRAFNNFFDKLDEKYANGVTVVLHHRWLAIGIIVALFFISIFAIKFVGFVFMPAAAANSVSVEFTLPQGSKLSVTEETMREFEAMALNDLSGVKYSTVSVGGTSMISSSSETNTGTVTFTLYKPSERQKGYDNEKSAKEKLRKYFTMFPGASLAFAANANSASSSSGVSIDIKSDDLQKVMETSKAVEELLKTKLTDWVTEVDSDLEDGLPQANIVFDRDRMQEFGLSIYSVGSEIAGVVSGTTASRFTKNGDDINVVVRIAEKDRSKLSDLDSISMVSSSGSRIPLSSFAHYEESTSPVTIYRENQARIIHVTAKPVEGLSLGDVQKEVEKAISENILVDEGVTIGYSGDMADFMEAIVNFGMVIILAAFLVFVVMASQFESILDPFIVILTIPLSFIGVVFIYAISGNQLNIVTVIGMLVLVGTIVNNGIVLVDYTNLLRKRGYTLEEACGEEPSAPDSDVDAHDSNLARSDGVLPRRRLTEYAADFSHGVRRNDVRFGDDTLPHAFDILHLQLAKIEERGEKSRHRRPPSSRRSGIEGGTRSRNRREVQSEVREGKGEGHSKSEQNHGKIHGGRNLMGYVENIKIHAGVQKRVELIFSQAIEEDFAQLFKDNKVACRYTKLNNVMGAGYSNPRLGDAIWPQLNVMYIIYCDEDECKKIVGIAEKLREQYIGEGIACFVSEATEM